MVTPSDEATKRTINVWLIKEETPAAQVAGRMAGAPAEKVRQRHSGYGIPGMRDPRTYGIPSETVAHDGRSGLDAALSGEADLILLDVMLPKINGYEICRLVRAQGLDVPILMVTAKGQEQDVVLGLNLGADDYVVKPFKVAELVARARAFLRRRGADRTVTRFGGCELDLRARTLSRDGKALELTAKEFKLLAYFASRPGCALARDTILNAVWAAPFS